MLHGGHLKQKYYQSGAGYFVRFIDAYKKHGVNIWGVTVQNEPMAKQIWESCIFSAKQEQDFVKNAVGPAFQQNRIGEKKYYLGS